MLLPFAGLFCCSVHQWFLSFQDMANCYIGSAQCLYKAFVLPLFSDFKVACLFHRQSSGLYDLFNKYSLHLVKARNKLLQVFIVLYQSEGTPQFEERPQSYAPLLLEKKIYW